MHKTGVSRSCVADADERLRQGKVLLFRIWDWAFARCKFFSGAVRPCRASRSWSRRLRFRDTDSNFEWVSNWRAVADYSCFPISMFVEQLSIDATKVIRANPGPLLPPGLFRHPTATSVRSRCQDSPDRFLEDHNNVTTSANLGVLAQEGHPMLRTAFAILIPDLCS